MLSKFFIDKRVNMTTFGQGNLKKIKTFGEVLAENEVVNCGFVLKCVKYVQYLEKLLTSKVNLILTILHFQVYISVYLRNENIDKKSLETSGRRFAQK